MFKSVSIICTPKASHKLHHGDEYNDDNIKSKVLKEFIFTYIYRHSLFPTTRINTIVPAIMQITSGFFMS